MSDIKVTLIVNFAPILSCKLTVNWVSISNVDKMIRAKKLTESQEMADAVISRKKLFLEELVRLSRSVEAEG